MQLWIDGQCLQTVSRFRGIGRYVREFIGALHDHRPDVEMSISFNAAMPDEAVGASELVSQWIPKSRIHVWQGIAEGGEVSHGNDPARRLSEAALAHHVACLGPELALSASPFEGMYDKAVPFVKLAGHATKTAAIFFDAIPYRFSEHYLPSAAALTYYERRLAAYRSFDLVFAISEFSRTEALSLLADTDVVNIDAGVSPDFLALVDRPVDPGIPLAHGIRTPYLLYVGGLDWRKNVGMVVEAYLRLPHFTRVSLQFVVAGDYPVESERILLQQWKSLSLPQDGLRMLGHVPDATLVQLYKQARMVVQPSLMEGFGLTALEAMTCGAQVIASRTGALPEVLGDPSALFDPTDPADIAKKIEDTFAGANATQAAIADSKQRVSHFSWARTVGIAADALTLRSSVLPGQGAPVGEGAGLDRHRSVTLGHVADLAVEAPLSALTLACAEPQVPTPPRLLVDVTATSQVDHATGIQRVVNRIATALQTEPRAAIPATLFYMDSSDGMQEAARDAAGKLSLPDFDRSDTLRVCRDDRVLMLDSSWEFHEAQLEVLRKARLQGAEVISTLYDLVPIRLPGFCDAGMPPVFALWLKAALHNSTGFVCISKAVADELLALLKAIRFPRRMQVGYWHLGADFATSSSMVPPTETKLKPGRPMFLMVGTIEPRKGYNVALDAFDKLWSEDFPGSLYIAGKRGWGVEGVIEKIRTHREFGKKLHWIEGPDDERLQQLYRQCDALVASSFGEGFGLPIVEAANHHKPVIASDIPVFEEVASTVSSAIFFETGSPDSLAAAIRLFAREQADYAARAKTPSRWLSWAESAKQLEAVVCDGEWYAVHEPSPDGDLQGSGRLGQTTMTRKLAPRECRSELTLVESGDGVDGRRRVVFKLANRSRFVWSSEGLVDGSLGIQVGYRMMDRDGDAVRDDGVRVRIPFVIAPGEVHYMAINVDARPRGDGAVAAHIDLVQEGVAWWDNPLRLPL